MKICTICKISKDESEFFNNRTTTDKKYCFCKDCQDKKAKEYRETHEQTKKCKKCKKIKPLTDFRKYNRSLDGLGYNCGKCLAEKSRKFGKKRHNQLFFKRSTLKTPTSLWKNSKNVLIKLKETGKKCELCGSKYYLTIHHKDGKGINYIKQGLKANNDINNLQILCRKCHGHIHATIMWAKRREK